MATATHSTPDLTNDPYFSKTTQSQPGYDYEMATATHSTPDLTNDPYFSKTTQSQPGYDYEMATATDSTPDLTNDPDAGKTRQSQEMTSAQRTPSLLASGPWGRPGTGSVYRTRPINAKPSSHQANIAG